MRYAILILSFLGMVLYIPIFSSTMHNRAATVKLGFVPHGKLYKAVLGNFRWFEGDYYTFKATIYYGGKANDVMHHRYGNVEYYNLYRTIKTAIILNPYNEDAYYFAQAAFAWDVGQVRAVTSLLEYVYKYRPWDFQISFFLGFDYAYFMHNYIKGAQYFKDAAALTHSTLFTNLAARYFYEGGKTELGIVYLKYMIKTAKDKKVKKIYKQRLEALLSIRFLENAVKSYKNRFGILPKDLKELVKSRIIKKIPKDPYGGRFYIDSKGNIKTTSKLAEGWENEIDRSEKFK